MRLPRITISGFERGWELGLVQTAIPEALGGYGDARSAVTGSLLLEELAYGDLALALGRQGGGRVRHPDDEIVPRMSPSPD